MQDKTKTILLRVLIAVSILGLLPLFAGVGTKLGFWEPITGFRMTMNYMNYSAVASLVLVFLVLFIVTKNLTKSIGSFLVVIAFAAGGYIFGVNQEPTDWTGVRGIHDVTTDMENPPEFLALLNAPGRRNSFDYPPETAERQRAKYPWVKPILTELNENEAYARALEVAKSLDWEIAGEDPSRGHIEATDYTKWFHFHDDVVIRVTAIDNGSRVDLRSLSRVGGTDHGLGAIRIMKFTKMFVGD